MSGRGKRAQKQLREERETVAHQKGRRAGDGLPPSIEERRAAAPRVAQEEARAADREVRRELAKEIKEGVRKLVGKE